MYTFSQKDSHFPQIGEILDFEEVKMLQIELVRAMRRHQFILSKEKKDWPANNAVKHFFFMQGEVP